ncbi:MAG: nuclear transport factor 2 family protein [Pseudomonadota bacterium]
MWEIEKRIRRLEDRAELNDLVVRYFLAVDDDDYAALAATFADDSQFSAGGFPGASGRDAIVESLRGSRTHMGATVHTPDYALFSFQSDEAATGTVGAHLELAMDGRTLYGAVRYQDAYVRAQGGWRIARRDMRVIHMGPWVEVGSSLSAELRVRWPGMDPLPSDFPKKPA